MVNKETVSGYITELKIGYLISKNLYVLQKNIKLNLRRDKIKYQNQIRFNQVVKLLVYNYFRIFQEILEYFSLFQITRMKHLNEQKFVFKLIEIPYWWSHYTMVNERDYPTSWSQKKCHWGEIDQSSITNSIILFSIRSNWVLKTFPTSHTNDRYFKFIH